ncbi:hypothetical protein C8Q73DRAFT_702534 [Cubamyces lactineus]|nr:hypothetical protein C8Q73DRAFT_702534 [Cubamyces lactineus]
MDRNELNSDHREDAIPMRIPVEVCERIIEHGITSGHGEPWLSPHRQFADLTHPDQYGTVSQIWYGRTTLPLLRACALTCRAWLPKSRACMYRHLVFGKTEKRALERLVRSIDENPSLRQLVLSFTVLGDGSPSQRPPDISPGRIPDIMHTWAYMLSCKLPMLTSIGMSFTYLRSRLERRMSVLRILPTLRSFTTVTSLRLEWYGDRVVSEADLLRLLTAFSNLRKLTLQSDWSYRTPEDGVAIPAAGPWKKEYALRAMPAITWLSVFNIGDRGSVGSCIAMRIIDYLLRATAPTLERLAIDKALVPYFKTSDQDDDTGSSSFAYHEMPRIRALHIHSWTTDTEGSAATQMVCYDALSRWLANAKMSSLDQLVFHYNDGDQDLRPHTIATSALHGMAVLDDSLRDFLSLSRRTSFEIVLVVSQLIDVKAVALIGGYFLNREARRVVTQTTEGARPLFKYGYLKTTVAVRVVWLVHTLYGERTRWVYGAEDGTALITSTPPPYLDMDMETQA